MTASIAESDLDLPTLWLRKRNWRVRLDLEKKKGREKKQAKAHDLVVLRPEPRTLAGLVKEHNGAVGATGRAAV